MQRMLDRKVLIFEKFRIVLLIIMPNKFMYSLIKLMMEK